MPRYSEREEELSVFLQGERHGDVVLGFYCGYSPEQVAHYLVYSTIRADKNVGAKVIYRIPYFARWRELRNKNNQAWNVLPTPEDFEAGFDAVTARIQANRMGAEPTDSIAGMLAVAEAVSHTRNDDFDLPGFQQAVIDATLTLSGHCGLTMVDREGKMHGRPKTFRRMDYLKLLAE